MEIGHGAISGRHSAVHALWDMQRKQDRDWFTHMARLAQGLYLGGTEERGWEGNLGQNSGSHPAGSLSSAQPANRQCIVYWEGSPGDGLED